MIQQPGREGPPDLDAFFSITPTSVGRVGAPISVGTGRAVLANHDFDSASAATAALAKARAAVAGDGEIQLCHVTFALDVDAAAVAAVLNESLGGSEGGIPVFGRSVNKKDAAGTVEVMLLLSDEGSGIAFGESAASDGGLEAAVREAAGSAAADAVSRLGESACTFLMFAHTPGADAEVVRKAVDAVLPGAVAYGGPAVGREEDGGVWALLGGEGGRGVVQGDEDGVGVQRVCVAAVPGSINFLISSVVAQWAQPQFTEPLSYMTPTYVDDPSIDLLTAIRYDDWEKFLWCIEEQGVSVNVLWENKQNQSPLLAACGRCRTRMIRYLLKAGADVEHRNAGNFTAPMYTRKLTEYDEDVVLSQLADLEKYGMTTDLNPDDEASVKSSSGDGRIFLKKVSEWPGLANHTLDD